MSEDDDFYVDAAHHHLGPVFTATYTGGECSGCGDYIQEDELIRADGLGGWVHRDNECEREVR